MAPDEIIISKSVMPELPPGYEESDLGDRMGATRQFRNKAGMHVREYEDRFVIHRDSFDPRFNPLKHLLCDSPETIAALGAGLRLALHEGGKERNKKGLSMSFSPLSFLLAFLSFDSVFRRLKHLLLLLLPA